MMPKNRTLTVAHTNAHAGENMRTMRGVVVVALAGAMLLAGHAALAQDDPSDPATPQEPASPRSPREAGTPRTPRTPRAPRASIPADDKDCEDFESQADAQEFFEAQGAGDPHRLDADDDGEACETLPRSARLPKTGSPVRAYGLTGSSLLLVGLLLLSVARRRRVVAAVAVARSNAPWGDEPLVGW